ncbi:hypothetical protein J7384_04640 [Endozoicomonas sp. G2_1]|uniref:DUF6776 family protein n=1 Tax=Endozoicomonas sp. G2_1 TaxID=2821091 RepID=UPI001ADD5134|nr:DUF6776 family protein [Endozoicomonas sp. G2_1]MBO9489646.1 hypothetical protein [Endozoicomonas sp. G2_1]
MNWLAKINLRVVVERLGSFRSALLLLAIMLICLFCGYRVGNFYHSYQAQTITVQEQRLTKLYQEQQQQVSRINTLEVELEVERLASERSMALLKETEAEHFEIKKELAFYQKVMAPEKQVGGLVVDSAKVFSTASDNHYRFQVALVQQQVQKRYAKGYIQLSIKGSLANKPKLYALGDLSELTQKELSFSFKYFQIVEGEFVLPQGFEPESIAIEVVLPKGKWQKYQKYDRGYQWTDILQLG